MTDALDKGYDEGRLAFRLYFAKYGPNVKQNDPRMPPNPYVGYYGFASLNGFEVLNCAATSRLLQARADSATSRSGFAFVERRKVRRLGAFGRCPTARPSAIERTVVKDKRIAAPVAQ